MVRCRWFTRDDQIGFSLEGSMKRWGDMGALALCIVAAWEAVGCACPHEWLNQIAKDASD